MDAETSAFLEAFYKNLEDRPVEPDEALYQPLYPPKDATRDPVSRLMKTIRWGGDHTVQLFSGFKGTGKSTELRRLRAELRQQGFAVALCDMKSYLNLTLPIDISDFVLATAGAFGDTIAEELLPGEDPAHVGYWDRFVRFMTAELRLEDFKLKAGTKTAGAEVKVRLRGDPDFRALLQDRMRGHISALVRDVGDWFSETVARIRLRRGDDTQVVLLLDSLEQIQGTAINAEDVHASVENLFSHHYEKLRLPDMHVVYSVPPWLKIRAKKVAANFNDFFLIPCLKVHEQDRMPCQDGLDTAEQLVRRRGDWERLLGSRAALDRLVRMSGGHLRDLFKLLRSCLVQADVSGTQLPIPERMVEAAVQELRNDYTPLSHEDARWLAHVRRHHTDAGLVSSDHVPQLARLFDDHLVLCYRNGEEWYDVHPALDEVVARLTEEDGGEDA